MATAGLRSAGTAVLWREAKRNGALELRLDGKSALVTGASSGIGKRIAWAFAEAGADVTVVYHRDRPGAEATADQIAALGRRAIVHQADVGDLTQVESLFEAHFAAFGGID
ncbi:MAG: SDR family NAD(P)-dependent oxidoreductase, partial [Thermomicrobiales bacterium]|nr:SDR family NAD(P)-dependent oxidoreductase [Thermomicrobiales bacterium]